MRDVDGKELRVLKSWRKQLDRTATGLGPAKENKGSEAERVFDVIR